MDVMPLMEAASSAYKRKYQCPYCEEKYDRVKLVDHIEEKHSEFIPKDFTAARIVFNIVNKKEKGKCTICGKESPWDENKGRYDRFCSEKCKKEYEKLAAERLKKVRGMTKQEMLKDPEYQNNVMLANRSISGKYKFQDGTIRTYVGSYERKFLEFMDAFLNVKSEDLETPGPIIEYKYKGETHKWITDAYYAPYNLVFDIKDGGDNPNKREMPEYRAKQTAKENAIKKQGRYNYIRLTDNKFEQLIELMFELKELYIENNGEYTPIVRINESVEHDKNTESLNEGFLNLKYKYLYHGSIEKYDLLQPYGIDLGNAFQKPGFSLFTFINKDDSKGWAIFKIVKKILKDNNLGKINGCNWSKEVVLLRDTYNKLVNILPKLSLSEKTYYIYTVKVQADFILGFGHSSNTKNCITIRNKNIKPYSTEKYILNIEDLNNNCCIIESEDQYSRKELDKMNGMNGRFLTPFMTKDAMYNWKTYRQLKNAIDSGEIKYDDESLNNYIEKNNINIYRPTMKDRLFIENSIITPCSDKPSQEGFMGRGSWNAVKRIDGEPYRERVEVIIFNKDLDKVLIGTDSDKIKLPGGGTDKNSSLESQAAKECQEEVRINIDNLKYIGDYSMTNDQSGIKNDVYKGQYTYLYLATYESDYTGYIRPEDIDSLYDTGKWIDIYSAKELLKKRSVDLYNLFNYNYKLYINDLSYLKL